MNTLLTLVYIARVTMMHTLLKPGPTRPVRVVLALIGRLVMDPFAAVLEVLISLQPIEVPKIGEAVGGWGPEPSVCREHCPCCGMHIPLQVENEVHHG